MDIFYDDQSYFFVNKQDEGPDVSVAKTLQLRYHPSAAEIGVLFEGGLS